MMKIKMVPIGDVKPYKTNPRRIPPAAVEVVKRSLEKFGWQQPLVVTEDMVLIVGHTRLLAAKELGHEKVPVKVASDLMPEEAREYRLVDNRSSEYSDWEVALLAEEVAALKERPIGWDQEDVDMLALLKEGQADKEGWEGDDTNQRNAAKKEDYRKAQEEDVPEGCVMLNLIVPKELEVEIQDTVREMIANHEGE